MSSDTGAHSANISFTRLVPVWCLVTYLFIQPYLTDGFRLELVRLREAKERLGAREANPLPDQQPIHFESGRNEFAVNPDAIRNIAVEDHYCCVHYRQPDGPYAKRDLAMPLRDV